MAPCTNGGNACRSRPEERVEDGITGERKHPDEPIRKFRWVRRRVTGAGGCDLPVRDNTTLADYLAMPKAEQDRRKNVGYIVGGHYKGKRQRAVELIERTLVILDADDLIPGQLDELLVLCVVALCDYEWVAYTTRKHTPEKPRLRIVIPLSTPVPPEHYEAVARLLAAKLGPTIQAAMDAVDEASFRANQVMYLPSVCRDGEYLFAYNPGRVVDPNELLGSFNGDWRNHLDLPRSDKRAAKRPTTPGKKAEDPRNKHGIIGAFCRAYGIEDAVAKFLPDVYVQGDQNSGRYSYAAGTTANGAIVYDGLWLYSHHPTDPAGDRLVNAFDLVRLHLFGHLDEDKDDDAKPISLPSFKAMVEHVQNDAEVLAEFNPDLAEQFDDLDAADAAEGELRVELNSAARWS